MTDESGAQRPLAEKRPEAGQRFGRLVVLAPSQSRNEHVQWLCQCDCGRTTIVTSGHLITGHTQSCGCKRREVFLKHGMSGSVEYQAFLAAKERCNNPRGPSYKHYGGRGIQFRFKTFQEFLGAIGQRPSAHHTVDRIDNDGHYEPGNIRWATRHEQRINQRRPLSQNEVDQLRAEIVRLSTENTELRRKLNT